MQLTRIGYSPLTSLHTLQRSMDQLLDQAFPRAWGEDGVDAVSFVPPVDISETADNLEFFVELPGFEKDQVAIRVEEENLILSGERKWDKETKEENFHRIERAYGKFQRTFALPTSVETGKITASLKNGVLRIVLPKAERAKPHQVPVSVS